MTTRSPASFVRCSTCASKTPSWSQTTRAPIRMPPRLPHPLSPTEQISSQDRRVSIPTRDGADRFVERTHLTRIDRNDTIPLLRACRLGYEEGGVLASRRGRPRRLSCIWSGSPSPCRRRLGLSPSCHSWTAHGYRRQMRTKQAPCTTLTRRALM